MANKAVIANRVSRDNVSEKIRRRRSIRSAVLSGVFRAKNDIAYSVYLDSIILTPWSIRIAGERIHS
jgi:hypothetical protein